MITVTPSLADLVREYGALIPRERITELVRLARYVATDPDDQLRATETWCRQATRERHPTASAATVAWSRAQQQICGGQWPQWLDRSMRIVRLSNVLPVDTPGLMVRDGRHDGYEQLHRDGLTFASPVQLRIDHGPVVGVVHHRAATRDGADYFASCTSDELCEQIAYGAMTGASWAGTGLQARVGDVNRVHRTEVRELSVSTNPAQPAARVALGAVPAAARPLGADLHSAAQHPRSATPPGPGPLLTRQYPDAKILRITP